MSKIQGTLLDDELVRIVKMVGENDEIDAKRPVTWDNGVESAGLAKDFAAFANSRNGGIVVIGKEEVEPGTFDAVGVTPEQAATFEKTKIAQWVNNHFSPAIRLDCYPAVKHEGKQFVVIRIFEFDDVPVICIKSFQRPSSKELLLKENTIYVRNANAESIPVGVKELSPLIGLATRKRGDALLADFHAILRGRPLVPIPSDSDQFQKEQDEILDTLSNKEALSGWIFSFHPSNYSRKRWKDRKTLQESVAKHAVRVTEQYPAWMEGVNGREWGIANDILDVHWAFAFSGLFVSYHPFEEDRVPYNSSYSVRPANAQSVLQPRTWIDFNWSVGTILQTFLFLSRIAEEYSPEDEIIYQFTAAPLVNRQLALDAFSIRPAYGITNPTQARQFRHSKVLNVAELRANWKEQCLDTMVDFFELFPGHYTERESLYSRIEQLFGLKMR
ncbi:MAG: ATP-binding protein [Thermoguttaceae bacterium]